MKRRDLIALLGGAAGWPLCARAQQPATPVIGFLAMGSPGSARDKLLDGFRRGLAEAGFVEGRNAAVEYRWAGEDLGRLPELASDLVARRVTVIAAMAGPPVLAANAATSTIPIVFYTGFDPVERGLVKSLARPGGNITGVSAFLNELNPKRVELLQQLVPDAKVFGLLLNPRNPDAERQSLETQKAASTMGRNLVVATASSDGELSPAFAMLAENAASLVIGPDPLFGSRRPRIVALAAEYRLATIYYDRNFVDVGGLISYGENLIDTFRQIGLYAGKIAAGAKPSELPVMRPAKFELVINLKTANALGLAVPQSLLARADEVIE
jgi:putative ABC transport system substrate-binding protein